MLSQERLKELLLYNPNTGLFTRRVSTGGSMAGDIAGGLDCYGYIKIKIDRKMYRSHRLAFLYMTGKFPANQTDHINGVRDDNRFDNLRKVTLAENMKNQKKRSNNTSGVMGVYLEKGNNKWRATIQVDGNRKHLGWFAAWFEAVCSRKSAEIKESYHDNHGRNQGERKC